MKQLKNYQIITFLLIILFAFTSCMEEKITLEGTGTIKGIVLDEKTSDPVINAEISTNPASQNVLTDSTGHFTMEDVQVGDYNVIAKQKDYFSATTSIKVNMNAATQVIINMSKRTEQEDLPEFSDEFSPAHEQEDVPVNITFSWQLKNSADTVQFGINLFEAGVPVEVNMENPTDTFAVVTGLKFSTTYLWQLWAENSSGKVYSDIRTFTTRDFPSDFMLYAKQVEDVSQIFITDTTGTSSIQITHNNFHSWRPLINPQKDKIAFLSTRDINPHLYVMNIDGSGVQKITSVPTGGYYNKGVGFAWLPDGERLVFSAYNKLYVVRRDGTGLAEITSIDQQKHFREVDWSPVNDKIVALILGASRYDAEIVLMDTDGGNLEVIVGEKTGALESPVFSIDGKKILYTYDISGFQSVQGRQLDARIFEYNIETQETREISVHKPSGTNDLFPRYTDNGARITFINTENVLDSRRDLWIMHSDSINSQDRKLLINNVEAPDW